MIPKFRAWNKLDKEMHDSAYPCYFNSVMIRYRSTDEFMYYDIESNDDAHLVLMQSTGLKDKNGVEIFEGDVIIDHLLTVLNGTNEEYYAVVKHYNYFYPKMIRNGVICNNIVDPMMFDKHAYLDGVEVVGNIYENEELLEVE